MSARAHTCAYVILAAIIFALPLMVHAEGTLYVSPEKESYSVGDYFDVQVFADSGGDPINAAEAELLFDPNELFVEEVSTEGSVLSLWPTPPAYSNQEGTIRFSGWTDKSYTGKNGLLITITFRALRITLSNARLAAGALLAADGKGSNIVTTMRSGVYSIEPKQIIPELPPEPEEDPVEETPRIDRAPLPPPPSLTEYPYGTIPPGERIIVRGSANPSATVHVWLARGDEPRELTKIQSAADGTFTFVSDKGLDTGIYRLWAQTVGEGEVMSEPSSRIKFEVRVSGSAASIAAVASVASAFIPFLILLILGGLGVAFMLHQYRVNGRRATGR